MEHLILTFHEKFKIQDSKFKIDGIFRHPGIDLNLNFSNRILNFEF